MVSDSERPRKRAKRRRGVQPQEVVDALHSFFLNVITTAAEEQLRRACVAEAASVQLLFRPALGLECLLNDEVALQLTFDDGRESPLLSGDHLDYVRSQDVAITSVAADPEAVGHISVLVGRPIAVYHTSGLLLPNQGAWARGIVSWDLRKVIVEAMGTADSQAGQELLKRLDPHHGWNMLWDRLHIRKRDWLPGALAELILEAGYEDRAAALLPLEYLHVEGQGVVLWRGWIEEKRAAEDILHDLVRKAIDEDALGTGLGGRRSKRRVVKESELAATSGDEEAPFSLANLPSSSTNDDLEAVELKEDLRRNLGFLSPAEREAVELWLQGGGDHGAFVRLCGGRGRKYDRMRKAFERATRRLRALL